MLLRACLVGTRNDCGAKESQEFGENFILMKHFSSVCQGQLSGGTVDEMRGER